MNIEVLRKHRLLVSIGVGITSFILFVSFMMSLPNPDLDHYRNDVLQAVKDPNVKCSYLQSLSFVGSGLWSFNPIEKQIGNIVQDKLHRGDCSQ